MAISFQLAEFADLGRVPGGRQPVLQLPPVKAKRYAAVGPTDALSAGALIFQLKNIGDPVYARLQLATETTQAAAGDALTLHVSTGELLEFLLPDDTNPTLWEIDIRAVA